MSSSSNQPIDDQWTTQWTDAYDRRALEYSRRTGASYMYGGSTTVFAGDGTYYVISSVGTTGEIDLAALRRHNEDSDRADRDHAAADMEIDTSNTPARDPYLSSTRSEKLRSAKLYKLEYAAQLEEVKKRIGALDEELKQAHNSGKLKELDGFRRDVPLLDQMLVLFDELNQLVLDETKEGRNWREGFEAQRAVRNRQNACCTQFSKNAVELGINPIPIYLEAMGLSSVAEALTAMRDAGFLG